MMQDDVSQKMQRLKAVKSAFILEAQSLRDRGLMPFALPFYQSAAQAELALADLFGSLRREDDAHISLFSAASCLMQARQFQRAIPVLELVLDTFPEAEQMIQQCRGRKDEPLLADTPELRALIKLLLDKGLITEDEWVEALQAASAG